MKLAWIVAFIMYIVFYSFTSFPNHQQ
uniref:Uncharacterized protein n=1 Tax=Arundo donax TaxID=35708 RepID=A0A0A9B9R8_ARUDO